MTEYQPGNRLGMDETARPRLTWLAYSDAGQLWAACYADGSPLRQGPEGWYRTDAKGHKVPVNDKVLARARACLPDELPVWPPQEELAAGEVASNGAGPRLSHQRASAVTVVPPVWRWRYWLVAAAVQLLVGRQGTGKSTFAAWVIAQLSTGRPWPGETEPTSPLRCGMLSLEEPAERIAARLTAAGADLDAVEILGHVNDRDNDGRAYQRPWRLPGDCAALEATIGELGLAVVTIDGLGYSVSGDSHNYANVGAALSALAGVAERSGATIVGLTHPPKGSADAVTAAIGSTAWTAVARISWVMGVDPSDETGGRRVVRPAPGSNYRLPDHGLSFTIGDHDETEAGFVTNLQSSDVDAQTITAPPSPESDDEQSARDEAAAFLRDYLALGAQRATDVKAAARKSGFADRTLARARKDEGIESQRDGFGPGTVYWWSLPCLPSESHAGQPPDAGKHEPGVANMADPPPGEVPVCPGCGAPATDYRPGTDVWWCSGCLNDRVRLVRSTTDPTEEPG